MNKLLTLRRGLTRTLALAGCSIAALIGNVAEAQSSASAGNVITPFYGTISPFYGTISPFYGTISPFYGTISPFYGNIAPFYGTISPFYGTISPFWGNSGPFTANPEVTTGPASVAGAQSDAFWGQVVAGQGTPNPFIQNPSRTVIYAQIGSFWTSESANWAAVRTAWSSAKTTADYTAVANMLQTSIIAPAAAFWGPSIVAAAAAAPATIAPGAVSVPTGPSTAFAPGPVSVLAGLTNIFTSAGVTFNADGSVNAASLASVSQTAQAVMFLNFYDSLMNYSGTGHVDWWMGATHWSPNLALNAALVTKNNPPVTIGMLDFSVSAGRQTAQGTLLQSGSNVIGNGHGTAVGSLIMGSSDGSNIMGVLPAGTANVAVYNPYDSTGTTNWTQVGLGIQSLAATVFGKNANAAPTGVLNASLGVPGWTLNPGWNTALASGAAQGHVLVVAAGNDGVAQTQNVPWNFAVNPSLLIVGSVGLNGQISNFSNQPGSACLVDVNASSTACTQANLLASHFIVAPGELILVADGNGGFSRQTGTSLAAPLVSGAVALLQARWPWLANYPNETVQIILKSATPLGTNPGADPVYGAGELNIQASQSPLSFSTLQFYQVTGSGRQQAVVPVPVASVVTQVQNNTQVGWNAAGLYFSAIEQIGNTHRDFQIPLASTLVGQMVQTEGGSQLFQSFLTQGLKSWVAAGAPAPAASPASNGFEGFMESSVPLGRVGDMELRMAATPNTPALGYKPGNVAMASDFGLIGPGRSLHFGFGSGATALDARGGMAQASDYQSARGGANPLLGLATGGAFVDWRQDVFAHLAFNVGFEQRRDERDLTQFGSAYDNSAARFYAASAAHLGVDVALNDRLTLHTSVTQLHEDAGLLGVQSLDTSQLAKGSTTTGATVGFDWALGGGYTISASGTSANTQTPSGQALRTAAGGLQSSAGEVDISKFGLFSSNDRLRLSVSKSMQVDSGRFLYSTYGVVDRQTGALGVINQTANATGGTTPVATELMYGRLFPKQGSELSLFVRAGTNAYDTSIGQPLDYVTGGKYRVVF